MKKFSLLLIFLSVFACKKINTETPQKQEIPTAISLTIQEASRLATLPLKCIDTEYPNKLGQTLGSAKDIKNPKTLHPAFYGCFAWHSAVHGHRSLIKLLKQFPNLNKAQDIKNKLAENLSKAHILAEVDYFKGKHNMSYERTYGWAWTLKLAEELHTWNDPFARELEANLKPLTEVMVASFIDFLPKLNYPIRVGEHANTAFALSFAYDYAVTLGNTALKDIVVKRARDFYLNDKNAPLSWEPGGFDFLSPSLEEVDIMRKVLPKYKFINWVSAFLPAITKPDFNLEVGKVSDRTDGNLVHLDGLNFSRAWCLYGLAKQYQEFDYLKSIANAHISYALPAIVDGNYEGGHWLGSFAIYALNAASK